MYFFSVDIVPFSTTKSFLILVPKIGKMLPAKNLMFCHVNTKVVLLSHHFFASAALVSRKVGVITTIMGFFFLNFCHKTCSEKTFSLLCSQVNWSGKLKSWPIKDTAQIRVVREHLPNINLTSTRKPRHMRSCSLTRVQNFFQIRSVQRSPQLAYVCLKYGRTCIDNSQGGLDCNDFHLQPFARFPSLLNLLGSS